jgi:hypothetical protein
MPQDIQLQGRSLRLIASDIDTEWKCIPAQARPSVLAMHGVASIADHYGPHPMRLLVDRFLAHSRSWRTPLGRKVRAELRAML